PSFPLLTFSTDPALLKKNAGIWTQTRFPTDASLGPLPLRLAETKIRIGYFSMDFRNHATSYLLAGLIEAHDRTRFEVYAFSYGENTADELRRRMERAFDKFIDIREMSDRAAAVLARRLGIDVAVDLAGHVGEARTGIMAFRAAPIQVSYLGYP